MVHLKAYHAKKLMYRKSIHHIHKLFSKKKSGKSINEDVKLSIKLLLRSIIYLETFLYMDNAPHFWKKL